MRIVIYGLNYPPELVGVAKYTGEMTAWLAARGHEVRVVTAPPHYPEWRTPPDYRLIPDEQIAGVSVRRCGLWLPRRYSPLKRMFSMVTFSLSSFFPLLRACWSKPDWLITIVPSFFSVPGAWLASRLSGTPLWVHVQDFELGAAASLGMVRGRALVRLAAAIEGWFLRRPERVSTISGTMMHRLADAGVARERRVLFPNWVDCQEIRPTGEPSPLRAELGLPPDAFVLLYSGSFGRKQGIDVIVEAARRLQHDRRYQFVLCGEGSERQRLQASAASLPNILWLPLQPQARLNDLLNLADIHLLPQRPSVATQVLPSKLLGMLASGRPVISTAVPGSAVGEVVAQSGALVAHGDPDALAASIVRLRENPELRQRLGASARAHAETHSDHDRILSGFEQHLRAPATSPGP